jgi:hypothetical protein
LSHVSRKKQLMCVKLCGWLSMDKPRLWSAGQTQPNELGSFSKKLGSFFLPFGPKIRDGGRVNPKNFGFFRERYDNLAYNLANGGDQGWL